MCGTCVNGGAFSVAGCTREFSVLFVCPPPRDETDLAGLNSGDRNRAVVVR